ncbi:MAG TPA: TetR/AcrR family transcriptional regulator [Candidatus Dormibacteraeota bacterium]|nr:TetR/AcrR family transcriptional regulator [Candidatus Dormibacteraeota bacterium]
MTAPLPADEPPRRRRRVQQRTLARRERLATVAGELIVERGFGSLSVNELAERCGISVGGMYRHIRTKTDVLVMACESIYGGVLEELTAVVDQHRGTEERIGAAAGVYLAGCRANRRQILMTYREYGRLPQPARQRYMEREVAIAGLFADLIAAGIAAGELRSVEPFVLAYDIVLLGHLPALKGWALRGRITEEELTARQLDLLMSTLRR